MDFVWISLGVLLSPSLSHFNPTLPHMDAPTTHTLSLTKIGRHCDKSHLIYYLCFRICWKTVELALALGQKQPSRFSSYLKGTTTLQ